MKQILHGRHLQHVQSNKQRCLCNLAGSVFTILLSNSTALSEVPRSGSRISRISIIRSDLAIYTDAIERHKGNVDEDGDNGVPK